MSICYLLLVSNKEPWKKHVRPIVRERSNKKSRNAVALRHAVSASDTFILRAALWVLFFDFSAVLHNGFLHLYNFSIKGEKYKKK